MIASIFTNFNLVEVCNNILNLGLAKADWVVLLISIIALIKFDGNKYKEKVKNKTTEKKLIIICTLSLIILVFGIYGIGFNVTEFIYSKF